MKTTELREHAARAQRLAWAVTDTATTDRLLAMSEKYLRHADELDALQRAGLHALECLQPEALAERKPPAPGSH